MAAKFVLLLILSHMVITGHAIVDLGLIKMATDFVAPFTDSSVKKLHSKLFGSGRAARSTDVAIINTTGRTFKLRENGCKSGGWTGTLFPENIIEAHHSIVYGAESAGFMTGVTKCWVKYKSTDGSSFTVRTSNPYFGRNKARGEGTGVFVKTLIGKGINNLVRFIVEEG